MHLRLTDINTLYVVALIVMVKDTLLRCIHIFGMHFNWSKETKRSCAAQRDLCCRRTKRIQLGTWMMYTKANLCCWEQQIPRLSIWRQTRVKNTRRFSLKSMPSNPKLSVDFCPRCLSFVSFLREEAGYWLPPLSPYFSCSYYACYFCRILCKPAQFTKC